MPDDKPQDVTLELRGQVISSSIGSVRISTSASGGMMFMTAARRLAASAVRLDDSAIAARLDSLAFEEHAGELMAASLAATLTAYLSIEGAVNDLLLAHSLGYVGNFKGLDPKIAQAFTDAWDEGAWKLNALKKANRAAEIAGAGRIDFGKGWAQKAVWLDHLRDELVHHKPLIVEHGKPVSESDDTLERTLGREFARATLWTPPETAPFRWAGCLGAGCAIWACAVADGFIRQVYGFVGVEFPMPPYC